MWFEFITVTRKIFQFNCIHENEHSFNKLSERSIAKIWGKIIYPAQHETVTPNNSHNTFRAFHRTAAGHHSIKQALASLSFVYSMLAHAHNESDNVGTEIQFNSAIRQNKTAGTIMWWICCLTNKDNERSESTNIIMIIRVDRRTYNPYYG